MIITAMKYDSITEIDIHGMRPEEAVKTLTKLINGAPDTVYWTPILYQSEWSFSIHSRGESNIVRYC